MAWEFAAIVRMGGVGPSSNMSEKDVKEKLPKWILVSPGKNPNPPRIKYDFGEKYGKSWESPVNKPYWAFTDSDERKFKEKADKFKKNSSRNEEWTTSTEGRSRKIHYESSDLLSLINEAGKEGWEITGGIGLADGQPRETRYRMMRREI
tara:strand:- start:136 stop:585 length:450 start_codon:yes stop_codon:yes gene_type:complete